MAKGALVNNVPEIEIFLKNINWDFYPKPLSSKSNPKLFNCRKYHWYPATFIPEIPYTLIELLTKQGAKIFDPFVGIGTTYFQALLLNRIPVCADICSFSTEFIKLLFNLFNPDADLIKVLQKIKIKVEEYNTSIDYRKKINKINFNEYLEELRKWYTEENFNALCFLICLEKITKDKFSKAALKLTISSILSTVSNQDRGWGCIADNVLPKSHQVRQANAIKIFLRALSNLIADIEEFKEALDYREAYRETANSKTIFHSNMIEFTELNKNSIDLVLTSPPYPNMVDYVTSQRLSYYYLGYDIDSDKKKEIGARHRRKRLKSLDSYLLDMNLSNKMVSKTIKKDGLLCYIMPSFNTKNQNNIRRKSIVQNVISKLEDYKLTKEIELTRSIPSLKRSHNSKWATLEKEKIYIFRKL